LSLVLQKERYWGFVMAHGAAEAIAIQLIREPSFHLGELEVHPAIRQVLRNGLSETLEPRIMQVLVAFEQAHGNVLSLDDLIDRCWGGRIVGENAVHRAISKVRDLGVNFGDGTFTIETITKVGYRMRMRSGLEAGSQCNGYKVPSANAGLFPNQRLARRAVIAGGASILLASGGVGLWQTRRRTRLAEVQSWTDRGDILLRDAVPLQAAEAAPPLRAALQIDRWNAKALGLLALTEETSANNGGSRNAGDTLRFAEGAARAALQRDPNEPHARLAMIDLRAGSLDWSQMEDRLEALRTSAPDNLHVLGSLTSFLQAAGRTSRSWLYNEQAAAAAPASPTPQWRRALRLWTAGRNEEALKLSERLLPLWPTHALVWNARFMILAFTGRTGAAAAMLRATVAPPANAHPVRLAQWLPTLDALANPNDRNIARAKEANLAAARLNPGQATYAAMALSQLGEIDSAFAVIDGLLLSKGPLANRPVMPQSFVANSPSWCRTQWLFMPALAPVRSDARFPALCEEIGLAHYWKQRGVGPDLGLPA
jgi:DNA-binding winged helix-turn-helix (wHTH) protein/tetratricopeptide (TPR) repeat protein